MKKEQVSKLFESSTDLHKECTLLLNKLKHRLSIVPLEDLVQIENVIDQIRVAQKLTDLWDDVRLAENKALSYLKESEDIEKSLKQIKDAEESLKQIKDIDDALEGID